MRILVCAKLVSEPLYTDSLQEQSTSRLSTGKLIMNPADAYGLELALRLRDTRPGSKLTILTLAPRSAENMLHTALAMGADEAVHVCDSCFAGSDTLATAVVLAAAVRAIDFQGLIVCGQKSTAKQGISDRSLRCCWDCNQSPMCWIFRRMRREYMFSSYETAVPHCCAVRIRPF